MDSIYNGSNGIQSHNHLIRKLTLDHLASLAKRLSVHLRTKWLWVRILLLSLKLQIWCLLPGRSLLTFREAIECTFTLEFVRNMIIRHTEFIILISFICNFMYTHDLQAQNFLINQLLQIGWCHE